MAKIIQKIDEKFYWDRFLSRTNMILRMFILIIALAGSLTSTLNAGFTRGQRIGEESKNAATIGPTGPQGIQGNQGPTGPAGGIFSGLYVYRETSQDISSNALVEFLSSGAFFGSDLGWPFHDTILIRSAGYYMITYGAILDSGSGSLQLIVDTNPITIPKIILECTTNVMSSITFLRYFDALDIINLKNVGGPITIKAAFPGVFFNIVRVQ